MTLTDEAVVLAFLPWGAMAFAATRVRYDFRTRLYRRHPALYAAVYVRSSLPPLLDIHAWLRQLRFELGAATRFAGDAVLGPLARRLQRTLWASFLAYCLALGGLVLLAQGAATPDLHGTSQPPASRPLPAR